ncbi:MAG: BMP family ABC transporter substrate-binding protein [Lachnospiraceae bacterium]|nr:BMP family ABC transporter substrate-binding protein [Lachnospiraceae bacterium]
MKMKRIVAMLLAMLMVLSLAACGDSGNSGNTTDDKVKVGIVLGTGGLGDKNFNDMAYAGLQQAETELGIEFDYLEPTSISDYVPHLRSLCEAGEYDLVIGLGADMTDAITEICEDFPEQKISHIDSTLDLANVSAISTKWQEQTFLAGVVAGLGTLSELEFANEDNVIGVILGQENPALRKGVVGYIAGARYVNPDVQVLEGNVDSFNDPGKGKEMALSMYNQGADFIQAIAGASGMGIYNASNEVGRYSFGVGANVNYIQPKNIVGTSARTVDQMVYNEIKGIVEGTWAAGLHISGIKEGAVGYDAAQSEVVLPAEIQTALDEIIGMLKDGTLVPPESMDDLDSWAASNQYKK